MKARRVGVLLWKELAHGSKSFMFIFAVLVPVVVTLVVRLLLGTIFSGKPRLGLTDLGESQIPVLAQEIDSLVTREYVNDNELREAVERGFVDMGLVLPAGFDQQLKENKPVQVSAYMWGESLLKNRIILGSTIVFLLREVSGINAPVEVVPITVGDGESLSWEERLFPFVVMITILIGGTMVPATSLVEEKQKRTLHALITSSATIGEVYLGKALAGILLSTFVGGFVLFMNQAFGAQPGLLMLSVTLSAAFAVTLGLLLGTFTNDINSLFTIIKGLGILLYAPAIVYLFPQIPEWVGKIFPTYYMLSPILRISQDGAGIAEVWSELAILAGLIIALAIVVSWLGARQAQKAE
ncbi:MAG: ABC transporter permease [Anaerolineales bacterium]|nr:MAG: ABC transporter permease [Anaerolineales bacterium]